MSRAVIALVRQAKQKGKVGRRLRLGRQKKRRQYCNRSRGAKFGDERDRLDRCDVFLCPDQDVCLPVYPMKEKPTSRYSQRACRPAADLERWAEKSPLDRVVSKVNLLA
jgi:hypothetical protein